MTFESEFEEWFGTLSVTPYLGSGAWGETWGPAESVPAFWDSQNKLVITSDGKSVTSDTRLYCGVQWRDRFPLGSRVTLPEDVREYTVVGLASWPGDDTHIEVSLA